MAARPTLRPGMLARARMAMSAAADAWSTDSPAATPYNSATTGGRMRKWRPTGSGPNAVVSSSSAELVRRSRDLKRNNPMGRHAIELLANHIVGTGIRPRPLCPDDATQRAITQLWDDWTKVSDADGTLDFYGQQVAAVTEMIAGGEVFGRLRSRRLSDGLPVPLQVQLIPPEQVPLDFTQLSLLNPGNAVVQGIEIGSIGNRVNYWVLPRHPNDLDPTSQTVSIPSPVPAEDMFHLFNATDRVGQMRGLPWLTSAMTTLYQIDQYLDAELVRKQVAAMMMGFLIRNQDEGLSVGQVAQMGETGMGPDDIPELVVEPGAFNVLNPGQDVRFNEPADSGQSFEPFLRAEYHQVAAAAGVLYQELTGDWTNANDRTFRAQFNTFKRRARHWQYNLVCVQFCAPIWNRFIDYAVGTGVLVMPAGMTDAELRRVAWSPDRWDYVNPVQDLEATGLELEMGLTSRAAAVAERGDDVETIDQQNQQDHQREQEMGLTYSTGGTVAAGTPISPPSNSDPAPGT